MIHAGDVFITELERGFFGAFRVLKTGGRFSFSEEEFYLIALTSYIDTQKPQLTDQRLKKTLCEKRFARENNEGRKYTTEPEPISQEKGLEYKDTAHINIYSGKLIEKHFEYLGNIPPTREETKMKIRVGDGRHTQHGGGYPLAGTLQKGFGMAAFWEWRWEHEREAFIKEVQADERQRAEAKRQYRAEMRKMCVNSRKETYRCRDGKSDKFWRIEYAGSALAVNYGKTGSVGTYKVKELASEAACGKEVKKLTASKVKKGYQPYPDFDAVKHFYFDDPDVAIHPLTSHPEFRAHFNDEFYYDCTDEEAPFGSDEGADALARLEEDFRRNSFNDNAFAAFPQKLVESYWGMTYLPASDISRKAVENLLSTEDGEMNLPTSDMVTYATAFAQIKITGRLSAELKTMALNALKRLEITAEILKWNTTGEITSKMISDLERFRGHTVNEKTT